MPRRSSVLSPVLLAAMMLVVMATSAVGAVSPVEVRASTTSGMTLVIEPGDVAWTEQAHRDGAITLHAPAIGGFVPTSVPGEPRVPVYGRWIVVPPGMRAELKIVESTWRDIEPRLVAPTPMPVFRDSDDPDRPQLGEELVMPGEDILTGSPVLTERQKADLAAGEPDTPFHLGSPVPWRGRRIAAVAVRPLELDAGGRARRVLQRAVVEIVFVQDGPKASPVTNARVDDRFASLLLNGSLLTSLPADPVSAKPVSGPVKRTAKSGTLLQPELRIPVTKTRLYRLEAQGLANAGLVDLSGVDERHVRLYQRRATPGGPGFYEEIEVPIHLDGDGGSFAGDDALVFWGLRARDDVAFTDGDGTHGANADQDEQYAPSLVDPVAGGNIYYLALSEPDVGEAWARMEEIDLDPAEGTLVPSYRRTDMFEEDTYHTYAPATVDHDRFYWNRLLADEATVALSVKSPVPGRNDVRLRSGVLGLSTAQRDYRFDLVAEGSQHLLGMVENVDQFGAVFDTQTSGSAVMSDWLEGSSFVVSNVNTRMLGYLDWFELDYEADYAAVDDALDFHLGDGTGLRNVEVVGFTDSMIHLYDISDPRRPIRCNLDAQNVVEAGGSWTLSLRGSQDASGARRFQALGGQLADAVVPFQYFRATEVEIDDDPTLVTGTPDVLVITHPEFRSEAERWAQYRATRGPDVLDIHIVDIHQLYGWFTGGMKHPDAIKAMTQYAATNWGTWALQIFGDAYQNTRTLSDPSGQRDWVPSRWHVWDYTSYANSLLPSDKWFANPHAGADYPDDTWQPPEMIVARFPCNSTEEAATMVDKVITFEASDGAWKGRSLFMADDSWSNGYQSQGSDQYDNSYEQEFEINTELQAMAWETLGCDDAEWCEDLGLGAGRIYLSTYLDPISPTPPREVQEFRDHCERLVLPVIFSEVAQSALFFQYQGHASDYLLADEWAIQDAPYPARQDIPNFDNFGRPFVFVGLGCHIAAWARDKVEYTIWGGYPSLGEKMLTKSNSAAVAVYASPGYEFLHTNARMSSTISTVWLGSPPRGGDAGRSRWILGELFLATETQLLATGADPLTRRLVGQFSLLGDGLMVLDAGPPRTQLSLGWDVVEDGAVLKARDASNELVVTLEAFDEGGVDRVEVRDASGADVAAVVTGGTPEGATDDQYVSWDVRLPFTPGDRSVVFHVYDTADVSDSSPHATVSVVMPTTVALYLDGRQFVPGESSLPGGEPQALTGRVVTSSWVAADATLEMIAADLVLSSVTLTRVDEHTVDMAFTVEVTGATPMVSLLIDGQPVEIPLTDAQVGVSGIADLNVFPNPVSDGARFVFRTDAGVSNGTIHLYSLAGHRIASLPVRPADFQGGGAVIVEWDGRDHQGDRPANGVYLYRVELDATAGRVDSGMQRLVVMH